MNAHDSERIKGMLEELGLGEASDPGEADVVVFNTCTIREKPDTKLAAYLGESGARKRELPDMVIAVGFNLAADAQTFAVAYPKVKVVMVDGAADKPIDNVSGRNSKQDYRWQVDALAKF